MIRLASFIAAATLAFALLAGAAGAQQPQAQPSQSHLAAARDVVISSGIIRSIEPVIAQFNDRIRQQAVARPEASKDLEQVFEALKPEMELQTQQMVNAAARVFANHMTEAELLEIATFFKTPAGRKYVETQPLVLDDFVKEMETWSEQLAEYIMVRVRAEMGKRGHVLQ